MQTMLEELTNERVSDGQDTHWNAIACQEGGEVIGEIVAVVVEQRVSLWCIYLAHVPQILISNVLWNLCDSADRRHCVRFSKQLPSSSDSKDLGVLK